MTSSSVPLGVEQEEEEEALSRYALALKAAAKGGAGKVNQPASSNSGSAANAGANDSGTYSHVEWRSIAEVIDYLGALLRTRNTEAAQWTDTDASGATVAHTLFQLCRS